MLDWRLDALLVLVGVGVVAQIYMLMKFVSFSHRVAAHLKNTQSGS